MNGGRKRAVIEGVYPEIDAGLFPAKRSTGDPVDVEADIFADGHEAVSAVLAYRKAESETWKETPMTLLGNDRWHGRFFVSEQGIYHYTVAGWVDHFKTWKHGLEKKHEAGVDASIDLKIGAEMVNSAASRASGPDASRLSALAKELGNERGVFESRARVALSEELERLMQMYPDRSFQTRYERELRVEVDRERASFSAWYEMFPRSASPTAGKHGTFSDCIKLLPYVEELGFDVLYFPPIHPIGTSFRKGKNNSLKPTADDPGSPWAIGSEAGGHKAIHPELGSVSDFKKLIREAKKRGIEIALDIAFQCSPDHPYVREHPDWFVTRPDGTIQYAENPPKKYEDIYPINFESPDWEALWKELLSIFEYWIDVGVKIFRVDNPHTKSFYFWEWAINELRTAHPDVIFLAEAFTRPRRMYRLAKLGYNQSYTYFTWRNSPGDMRDYLTELTGTGVSEYYRPNFWPNTPDILHHDLQTGGRGGFITRLVLAATLSSNYGIYGPAFELLEHTPREPGSEEYLNSEKYEIKKWNRDRADSLKAEIGAVNTARRENPALQRNRNLRFHNSDNPNLLCYSKATDDGSNVVMVVVNMDFHNAQTGRVEFSPAAVGLSHTFPFTLVELLSGETYTWREYWNFVSLDPESRPVHILKLEK